MGKTRSKNPREPRDPVDREVYARKLATVKTLLSLRRTALRTWLHEPVRPAPARNELLLKVWFGAETDVEGTLANLRGFRAAQVGRLAEYREIERAVSGDLAREPGSVFPMLTLRFSLRVMEASVRWADEAITVLITRSLDAAALHGLGSTPERLAP
jgi:hypothetical protein